MPPSSRSPTARHGRQGGELVAPESVGRERHARRRAEVADQGARRVEGDDAARVHDRRAIAQLLRLLEVVRGDHDRAALGRDRADHVPQVASRLRVEAGRRLVEEDDLGLVHEREGDREPLLLAAGELACERARLRLEPDRLEQPLDALAARGARRTGRRRARAARSRRGCRRARSSAAARRSALHAARIGPDGPAEDLDRAAVGPRQALDHLEGRRLACAVRTEDPERLAGLHGQVDAAHGLELAVRLRQAPDEDRVHGGDPINGPGASGDGSLGPAPTEPGPAAVFGEREGDSFRGTSGGAAYVGVRCSSSPRIESRCPRRSAGHSRAVRPRLRERALIRAAQAGSSEAVEELFRRHWAAGSPRRLPDRAGRGRRGGHRAGGLRRRVRALDRFDRRRPFAPWLHRIVANRAIDWSRARSARREVEADEASLGGREDLEPPSGDVLAALAALPPEQRAVVVLRHLLGYTPGTGREAARPAARHGQLAPAPRARPARRTSSESGRERARRCARPCARKVPSRGAARRDARPHASCWTRSRRASPCRRAAGARACGSRSGWPAPRCSPGSPSRARAPRRSAASCAMRSSRRRRARCRRRPMRLPGGGSLLVRSPLAAPGALFVVHADGSRRLLGPYRDGSWSPHARFVVATAGSPSRARSIHAPARCTGAMTARAAVHGARWSLEPTVPPCCRVAYLSGRHAADRRRRRLRAITRSHPPTCARHRPGGPATTGARSPTSIRRARFGSVAAETGSGARARRTTTASARPRSHGRPTARACSP